MPKLADTVYKYYLNHFSELPADKQFHFASRLYLWDRDAFGAAQIPQLRPEFSANDDPAAALQKIYKDALDSPVHGSKNAAELRRPYFEKYPQLKTQVLLLFRTAFLLNIYRLDARNDLFDLVPQQEFEATIRQLLADDETVAILSTHAINLIYLYSRIIRPDEELFDPGHFLDIGRSRQYKVSSLVHVQLLIYLYTHCIIGESQFYYRAVPERYKKIYQDMLTELEDLIDAHFDEVNLDNKFEFLVCCKMLGMTSKLRFAIFEEAKRSLSPDGDYLIDTLNNNPQSGNTTLDTSEHRNVLFLMSQRDFQPLG